MRWRVVCAKHLGVCYPRFTPWPPQIITSVPLAPALLAPLLASSVPHRLQHGVPVPAHAVCSRRAAGRRAPRRCATACWAPSFTTSCRWTSRSSGRTLLTGQVCQPSNALGHNDSGSRVWCQYTERSTSEPSEVSAVGLHLLLGTAPTVSTSALVAQLALRDKRKLTWLVLHHPARRLSGIITSISRSIPERTWSRLRVGPPCKDVFSLQSWSRRKLTSKRWTRTSSRWRASRSRRWCSTCTPAPPHWTPRSGTAAAGRASLPQSRPLMLV